MPDIKNEEYWRKRAEQLESQNFKRTLAFEKQVNESFNEVAIDIENRIKSFLIEYSKENGITFEEANKNLTPIEFSDYKRQMNTLMSKYKNTNDPTLKAQIDLLNARQTRTRLEALENEIQMQLNNFAHETTEELGNHLYKTYAYSYEETHKTISSGLGIENAFNSANIPIMETILSYPYTGKIFSEHIWASTNKLASSLVSVLKLGLVQGKSIPTMSKELKEKLSTKGVKGFSNYDVTRVIRTEVGCMLEKANLDVYEENGLTTYKILTAHDERTCPKCGKRDGEVHKNEDRKIGLTAPPFHPLCRCTTTANKEELENNIDKILKKYGSSLNEIRNK